MTQIEWTHLPGFKGESWNPIVGCSVVSPGCTNCYAMKMAGRILRMADGKSHYAGTVTGSKAGPVWTGKVARASDKAFTAPLRARDPRCYFVNSMGDLFAENVPDEWIDKVFAVMALSAQHRFIVLTKRPERMRDYFSQDEGFGRWGYIEHQARKLADVPPGLTLAKFGGRNLPNVWLGVSVEDQARADERIPLLLDTPAAVRFISAEPLLGCVDLTMIVGGSGNQHGSLYIDALTGHNADVSPETVPLGDSRPKTGRFSWNASLPALDWVIVGGESGPGARPMHPDWARSLRDQCAIAGVPFFFKQWGRWVGVDDLGDSNCDDDADRIIRPDGSIWPYESGFPDTWRNGGGAWVIPVGKKLAGHLLDGVEHFNWPVDPAGVTA